MKNKIINTIMRILYTLILVVALIIIIDYIIEYRKISNIKKHYSEVTAPYQEDLEGKNIIEKNVETKKLSKFDLSFLKLENQKENKIYSPLSIKYALKMLDEASNGNTKAQISKLLGEYPLSVYESSENLSIANSFFIRDSFKNQINKNYINILKNSYGAEIQFDSFDNAKNINNWINEKTFEVIPEIISDENVKELDFALINALAIDMEWKEKFVLGKYTDSHIEYLHEQGKNDNYGDKIINSHGIDNLSFHSFKKNNNEEIKVSGMWVEASINNYDIINELGEENIKQIVAKEYRKFAKGEPYDKEHVNGDILLSEDVSDIGIEEALSNFLPRYISEINSNYQKCGTSTEFSLYTNEEVKIFAKDLKEYNNTILQYIGIMPIKKELNQFITDLDSATINSYISNLKTIRHENFKEGIITKIEGFIPKFDFEYDLNLMEDLKLCNITDIFDKNKADLSNMIDGDAYLSNTIHKANIKFTQDGIKAAAATFMGGYGAGAPFDYLFDVPIVKINITFYKPFMFLIRDKENGEVWFIGTVYEPLLWENEPEKENVYSY